MTINQQLLSIIEIVIFAIALGLFIPIAVLFVECCFALFPRCWVANDTKARPRIDVLVPAHNEALGISATLKTILPQLTAQDRLVVIADNCEDETADVARALGATAIERRDLSRQGKGYALDYGLRFIAANPPEAVVFVDADCIVHPGTIERLARLAVAATRPVQATYLMQSPKQQSVVNAISQLALTVKNLVRPSGLDRLGLPCLLTGSGMAFPWCVIHKASLASGNIVEDMQLAVELAINGYPSMFCSEAQVRGLIPQQQSSARSQRTRWEHGHLQTILTQVPRLLKAAFDQKRFDLLAIALDLCVPPLSLLVMFWAMTMSGALLAGLGGSWTPTIILATQGILILLSIVGAWAKYARENLSLLTLLSVPLYILWKIPLYFAFLMRPQTKWIRTERDVTQREVVDASQF